jgi:hypothetical protein
MENGPRNSLLLRRAFEIYLSNAENNRAVTWTIGSKRNANSNVECFGARTRDSKSPRHRRVRDER